MFKNIKLGKKLLMSFLAVGLIPFAVIGISSLMKAKTALSEGAFNRLESVREIKKTQIEQFFDERAGDMGVLVETVGTLRQEAFNKLTAVQAIKKAQVSDYFNNMRTQLNVLKGDPMILSALGEFDRTFTAGSKGELTEKWESLAEQYDSRMEGS